MSEMDYSRLPREAAEALNPMIGALTADTLHTAADMLLFIDEALERRNAHNAEMGLHNILSAVRFAIRYEAAHGSLGQRGSDQATEDWPGIMLNRPVENVRAKLILMLLAADADADGKANASPALLARRAGMSEANALTALRWLERNKFIVLEDEPAFTAILHA